MHRLLYGTGNPAKLISMRQMLSSLPFIIDGLDEDAPPASEDGNTPLANARQKALCYYQAYHRPVFSCDSGMELLGVPEDKKPGVHLRRPEGRSLSDEEMIEHYTSLVRAYGNGGCLQARYQNAICLIKGDGTLWEYDGDDICSNYFLLTDKPHIKRTPGWPLDSLSLSLPARAYWFDMTESEKLASHKSLQPGFEGFFKRVMLLSD